MNFKKAEFIMSAVSAAKLASPDYPEFVFSGRSNVGKSSLINTLLERKSFARVSATPGKTASINFYLIDQAAYLCDLPGYGYAKVSRSEKEKWRSLIDGYFSQSRDIRLVIQLVDARIGATKDDLAMINSLYQADFPFVVVATKVDKLSKTKQQEQVAFIEKQLSGCGEVHVIPFSSKTKVGREDLIDVIEYCLEDDREEA